MTPLEQQAEKKVGKTRTINNLVVFVFVIPALFAAFRYFNDLMSLVTGTPVEQIGDLGPDALQPILLVCLYIAFFATFSALMAAFFERQLKEGAYGSWSRFGLLFLLFFSGACLIAAGIL